MKKIIITGATGFIGGELTRKFLQQGIRVYGVGRDERKLNEMKKYGDFISIIADFTKYNELSKMINETDIDVFYHFAWQGYGKETNNFDVQILNVNSTYEAAKAASELGCRKFVFACSSHEYQKNYFDNDETSEVGYCSIYGASKIASKAYARVVCHNHNIEFNGAIFTNVFGVGDCSNRSMNLIISQFLKGQSPKLVSGEHLHDWIYIDDALDALILIGEKGINGKEYCVGNSQLRTFKEIITEVRDIVAPNVHLKFGEYNDSSFIDYSCIDLFALHNDTGFECKADFKKSILKTSEWVKAMNI